MSETVTKLPYAVVDLRKEQFKTWGSNSLEGICVKHGIMEPQRVMLRFHQTSTGWRHKNGGADLYIVPEFMPFCLVDSILRMTARGFQFEIETVEKEVFR